eukprot:4815582-Amphidinium_carterae.2
MIQSVIFASGACLKRRDCAKDAGCDPSFETDVRPPDRTTTPASYRDPGCLGAQALNVMI